MITIETVSADLAEELCRKIIADLPEYFGLPEVNEHYAIGVRSQVNLAAKVDKEYVGLVSICFPYPENANIYWMGILRKFHRAGIGHILSASAFHEAKNRGAKTISVETLSPQEADENYLKTYSFYKSLDFSPLFNLKPDGYAWNMVYMLKSLDQLVIDRPKDVLIRPLLKEDINIITEAFSSVGWNKPVLLFENYLNEAEAGERLIWVAFVHDRFAGYITLKWQSQYSSFREQNVPEIMDLNVLPRARKIGVGSMLLDIAEKEAATRSDTIGIGVGLYAGEDGGYGNAQKLYVKRDYIPDGKGVTYNYQPTIPGNSYPLDDDLVLWFTKKLR
jgi:GNAT superfamily N-acetyltransferase